MNEPCMSRVAGMQVKRLHYTCHQGDVSVTVIITVDVSTYYTSLCLGAKAGVPCVPVEVDSQRPHVLPTSLLPDVSRMISSVPTSPPSAMPITINAPSTALSTRSTSLTMTPISSAPTNSSPTSTIAPHSSVLGTKTSDTPPSVSFAPFLHVADNDKPYKRTDGMLLGGSNAVAHPAYALADASYERRDGQRSGRWIRRKHRRGWSAGCWAGALAVLARTQR
ncbi:hypothetical protein NM688_g4555 [Phlebia brevispora]|uniref:Uncharacterized protein n=1 Tax=Phlebia brevispora TaxID=194682 RepID=A0ACC1T2L0_9APHY|nr:hypothetical protein NM688_g4555 [Phlebia brevispora]